MSGARLRLLLGTWQRPGAAYTALADALRAAVLSGALPLRTRVPSERELAEHLGVSRTTATAVYDVLRAEGYLVSRRGSGTVTALPADGSRADRSPAFGGPAAEGLVDLSMAAPSASGDLAAHVAGAVEDLAHHTGGRGYEPLGLPVLRAAVAGWYEERGVPTSPDHVLVTTGAQHALHLLVAAHAGPGDRVVVEHPTYLHAIDAVRGAGARPVPVPVGRDGLDVDLLASTLRQAAPRLVYLVPDHHNPTGTSVGDDARARVRELARRTGTVVVADEVLSDLTVEGPAPVPFLGTRVPGRELVGVGSASKSFWGGLRVGWVRAHPELVARLAVLRGRVDIATPVLEQLVVARLLAARTELLERRRAALRERRDLLVRLLGERLPSWRYDVPAGGLSVWVDLGAARSTALAAIAPRHGVRLVPGTAFGTDGSFDDRLRLTFSEPAAVLDDGLRRVAAAWSALGEPAGAVEAPPWRAVV
ncbi:GntR family transcriptional regulator [Cellulomonas marina]|uniref:DNA-binding transcriptional regulator, MocR family, contains an aminotransferase domain n=1 Tax=Cellulomonas marina TaxID=988821 RepID=A0A1I0W013_9CELL|nr:GntR family transcriptional regulator [Cellulomonas marina]SFA81788.1 DNA-binding transcriptional regulator, MocR family, contains an aminotransferase domain [Cellulomonas marina]